MDKAPNGIWALFPAAWSFLAWILSITSSCVCAYVSRIVSYSGIDPPAGTLSLLLNDQGIGFWGWSSDGTCYSYEISGMWPTFDGSFKAAGAFTTLTDILGGFVMICLLLGTNFPIAPKKYEILGYASLLVAVLNACSLIILGSSVCAPDFFQYVPQYNRIDISKLDTSCTLGSGATMAVFAVIFWVVTAFGCLRTPLASRKREINPLRRRAMKDGENNIGAENMESLEENGDSAHRQRQVEHDKRYRQFMGDADGEDVPGFESIRKNRLSLVPEDESVSKTTAEGEKGFEDEFDENENHSETRSQYSKSDDDEEEEFHDEEKPLNENASQYSAKSRGGASVDEEESHEEQSLVSATNSEIV